MLQSVLTLAMTALCLTVSIATEDCLTACTFLLDPQCVSIAVDFPSEHDVTANTCEMGIHGLSLTGVTNGNCNTTTDSIDHQVVRDITPHKRDQTSVCATFTAEFGNKCVMKSAICSVEADLKTHVIVTEHTRGSCSSTST